MGGEFRDRLFSSKWGCKGLHSDILPDPHLVRQEGKEDLLNDLAKPLVEHK
jgi:hypothetical protein